MMEINSFLTGKRGVSLPFTDYCDPIIDGNLQFDHLLNEIIFYGKTNGWKYLEVRSKDSLLPSTSLSITYIGHTLNLTDKEDRIFSNFKDTTRRNIKKAIKEGVEIKIENTFESLKDFYKLNCLTRKRHGLPPQPFKFFKKIFEHIISNDMGLIILAIYNRRPIAGAIYFHFGDQAIYKYGASDLKFQHLRPNNLVMWEAIKCYAQKGYKKLCLGRTEPENQGLIQFKSGWGAEEQRINYYRYSFRKELFAPINSKVIGFHNKIFRNLPIPFLIQFGRFFYKYTG